MCILVQPRKFLRFIRPIHISFKERITYKILLQTDWCLRTPYQYVIVDRFKTQRAKGKIKSSSNEYADFLFSEGLIHCYCTYEQAKNALRYTPSRGYIPVIYKVVIPKFTRYVSNEVKEFKDLFPTVEIAARKIKYIERM